MHYSIVFFFLSQVTRILILIVQIAIEFCDAGSCLDVIRRMRRPLTEKEIKCTLKQVVQGLQYIHSRIPQICHRDIKVRTTSEGFDIFMILIFLLQAGNILLNSKGEAKLGNGYSDHDANQLSPSLFDMS